jgi:hypothetical protein
MSMEKKNDTQQQSGHPDRQKAPVESNQARESLCRLYELFISFFSSNYYFIFSNYHEDNEGLINRQINLELYASYVYMGMAHYYNRSDVALKGQDSSLFSLIFMLDFRSSPIFQENV